ncbi:hypothetical protein SynBIOSE41_03138 [Synechococcus sp. BIOS-E4-1]|nr:hypothetical protein SynBIOSE41_03138 [Synechococcus sp. BIOS-E4-1]
MASAAAVIVVRIIVSRGIGGVYPVNGGMTRSHHLLLDVGAIQE